MWCLFININKISVWTLYLLILISTSANIQQLQLRVFFAVAASSACCDVGRSSQTLEKCKESVWEPWSSCSDFRILLILGSRVWLLWSSFPRSRRVPTCHRETAPQNYTTIAVLHLQGFAKHSTCIQATEFTSSPLRPENLLPLGRLQTGCHMHVFLFFLTLILSGHSTTTARLMDCCSDACLWGRFSHLCNSEALCSWSPRLPRRLLPGYSVWPGSQLLKVLLALLIQCFTKMWLSGTLRAVSVSATHPHPPPDP